MFGYGNSENTGGIIIGVLIGAVIVFLICRELICWYWKINKIVALMEEQNDLLKDLIGSGRISGKEDIVVLQKPLWKKKI